MGLTGTVNDGDVIASAWGNEIRDRALQVFASVAERDAQWLSPPNGAQAVTLDTNTRWYRRGGAWVSLPNGGGMVCPPLRGTSNTGAVGNTELVIGGGQIVFTADPARMYRISFVALVLMTVAGDNGFIRLRQSNSTGPQITGINVACQIANFAFTASGFVTVTGWSGTQTVVITLQRNAGTGTIALAGTSTAPYMLTAEDVGMATPP